MLIPSIATSNMHIHLNIEKDTTECLSYKHQKGIDQFLPDPRTTQTARGERTYTSARLIRRNERTRWQQRMHIRKSTMNPPIMKKQKTTE